MIGWHARLALMTFAQRMVPESTFTSIALGEAPGHWEALADLWLQSAERSPFQSPAILRHHAANCSEPIRLFTLRVHGDLRGAAVLKQDASRTLTFLSDLKTDINHFLFHASATEDERRAFFSHLFTWMREEHCSLTLNNQPGDTALTGLIARCAEEAGLFCAVMQHSACPVVEAGTPEELFAHVNGLRELRYRVNKLHSQKNAVFETFTDAEGLDRWTGQFCAVHIRRWQGTATPSNLRHAHRRDLLQGCLSAWAADGLLVRFSVRVEQERVGFVIGLRATDHIIHHSTTYDPSFAKYSPGKALILHMAEWMRDNGYRTLDFGDGREAYKYTVATGERPMARIFIARKDNLRFIAASSMIRMVRGNSLLNEVYQRHIRPRIKA